MVTEHIEKDPDKVKKGLEIITESLMLFVKGCIKLGLDGFYASTQGGESDRFGGKALFTECIKPYDLAIMEETSKSCIFNILHICDYHSGYDDLTPFLDYPGHVVNYGLKGGENNKEWQVGSNTPVRIWANSSTFAFINGSDNCLRRETRKTWKTRQSRKTC